MTKKMRSRLMKKKGFIRGGTVKQQELQMLKLIMKFAYWETVLEIALTGLLAPSFTLIRPARDHLACCIRLEPNNGGEEGNGVPQNVDWRTLKGKQRKVFLQVVAYFMRLQDNDSTAPHLPPLRLNVDGTAGMLNRLKDQVGD
jgi:hypothetical protein